MAEENRVPELVIEAGRAERQYWRDLWRYRELFYFLAWRDILVRYKQTVIGVAWSLVRPLLTMVIFTFLARRVAKLPEDGVPHQLTVFAGVLAWNFFSVALQESGQSLVTNSNLVSKVYFPRIVVPAASVITALVDFLISAALLIILFAWFKFAPPAQALFIPIFILMAVGAAIGAGLWISALTVKYRDMRFIVPFIVQFGLFVSPVWYKTITLPEEYRLWFALNPMVGVIDGFRFALLGGQNPIYWPAMIVSAVVIATLVVTGIWYFRRTERSFADVI